MSSPGGAAPSGGSSGVVHKWLGSAAAIAAIVGLLLQLFGVFHFFGTDRSNLQGEIMPTPTDSRSIRPTVSPSPSRTSASPSPTVEPLRVTWARAVNSICSKTGTGLVAEVSPDTAGQITTPTEVAQFAKELQQLGSAWIDMASRIAAVPPPEAIRREVTANINDLAGAGLQVTIEGQTLARIGGFESESERDALLSETHRGSTALRSLGLLGASSCAQVA